MKIFPQEIEVWYVLPALRKELAIAMKSKGLRQRDIAKKMDLSEAAVSQYFKKKRANEIRFNNKIREKIKESAGKIIKNNSFADEISRLCILIKKEKVLCQVHKKYCEVPGECSICT